MNELEYYNLKKRFMIYAMNHRTSIEDLECKIKFIKNKEIKKEEEVIGLKEMLEAIVLQITNNQEEIDKITVHEIEKGKIVTGLRKNRKEDWVRL